MSESVDRILREIDEAQGRMADVRNFVSCALTRANSMECAYRAIRDQLTATERARDEWEEMYRNAPNHVDGWRYLAVKAMDERDKLTAQLAEANQRAERAERVTAKGTQYAADITDEMQAIVEENKAKAK